MGTESTSTVTLGVARVGQVAAAETVTMVAVAVAVAVAGCRRPAAHRRDQHSASG